MPAAAKPPAMYQPTQEELANLNNGMNSSPKSRYYERAREILANVNANLVFDLLTGWFVHSQSDANLRHPIDTRYEPPLCTCLSFQSDPTEPNTPHIFLNHPTKGAGRFLRRQCKHTIAYMGYRSILAQHCSLVQHAVPRHIPLAMRNGIVQPATASSLHTFACWLPLYYADKNKVTLISMETWHPWKQSYLQ
jgi:hypothetical protein